MTKKSFAFLAFALGFSLARAEPTLAHASYEDGPVLFTCEGVSFRDFDRWDLAFRSLAYADHTARFHLLRAAGKSQIFMQAKYTFKDEAFSLKEDAKRTSLLLNAETLGMKPFGAFSEGTPQATWIKTLFKAGNETYVGSPSDPRYKSPEFLEYITFPRGSDSVSGAPIPVIVKITQASRVEARAGAPAWSMLYNAECTSRRLREQEYEAHAKGSYREVYGSWNYKPSERVALLPSLQGALGSLSIYSAEGELLAGKAATLGGAAMVATAATQLVRAVMARLARSPVVAAYFLPTEGTAKFTLDVKAAGLTAEQAQEFFAATSRTQEALCEQNEQYREFCRSVSALDFEIARQQGRAL